MVFKFNLDFEIKNNVARAKGGYIKKETANQNLNNILELTKNPLFKGQKREIKQEVFKAKKQLRF